ncbi:MAG: hypothetical protein ACLGG8_04640 [Gammaproteobacteria bacterium]
MSTLFTPTPRSIGLGSVASRPGTYRPRSNPEGARGLATMLLAAVIAALVVVADRLISTWADGHLLLAWVVLWAVIFAGTALFAGAARQMASRAVVALDGWSRALAEKRADARLWELAKSDPRVMSELLVARQRDEDGFDAALAPLGMQVKAAAQPVAKGWSGYIEGLARSRTHNMHLYYI